MSWQERLELGKDEKLIFISQFDAGHLGQEERKHYEVLNESGEKVGSVKYVEHMDTKAPFNCSYSLQQYDLKNNILVSEQW
jgi:hypothetical protein